MLLTGFESYGGRSLNPAEQVVKRLGGSEILISLPQVLSDADASGAPQLPSTSVISQSKSAIFKQK